MFVFVFVLFFSLSLSSSSSSSSFPKQFGAGGGAGGGCIALTWSEPLYINIHVRGIFVSRFLKLITSRT